MPVGGRSFRPQARHIPSIRTLRIENTETELPVLVGRGLYHVCGVESAGAERRRMHWKG